MGLESLFLVLLSVILILISGCVMEEMITEKRALEIAQNTEEVNTFLGFYGRCEGCNPAYSEGYTNLIGCVEYSSVKDSNATYHIEFWVSEACSFRYGSSMPQERIRIFIDSGTGAILSKYPDIAYIRDPGYCEIDDDCICKSGSGVEFAGCGNFLHARTYWSGSYECERCKCRGGLCQTVGDDSSNK